MGRRGEWRGGGVVVGEGDGRGGDGVPTAQQQPRLHLGDSVQVVCGDLTGLVGWVMVVGGAQGGRAGGCSEHATGTGGADGAEGIPKDWLAAITDTTGCGCGDADKRVTEGYGKGRAAYRHEGVLGGGRCGYVFVCIPGVPGQVSACGGLVESTLAEETGVGGPGGGGGGGRCRHGRRGHWLPQTFLLRVCGRR